MSRISSAHAIRAKRNPAVTKRSSLARARAIAIALASLLAAGLAAAGTQSSGPALNRNALQHMRISPKPAKLKLLPDLVIRCASVYPVPNGASSDKPLMPGDKMVWYETAVVANVGLGTANMNPDYNPNHYGALIMSTKNLSGNLSRDSLMGSAFSTYYFPYTLASGATRTLQMELTSLDLGEFGIHAANPPKFYLRIIPAWHLKESRADNDTYGPVTVTKSNTCGAAPHMLRRSSSFTVVRRVGPAGRASAKLNPQPEPPSSVAHRPPPIAQSPQGAKLAMHKIGLAPRPGVKHPSGLSAMQLPNGWTHRGGIVRAQRGGLRLKLSNGRVLASRRATNGRISYLLLDAGGRVVQRIRSNETLRLVSNGMLAVQETTGRHRQVLLGRVTKARNLR